MNENTITQDVVQPDILGADDLFPFHEAPYIPLVLVADDNETHLLFTKRLLESKGFECVTTTSPTTAVRVAQEKHPAIVLCDINFGIGKSSGIDVITEIRRTNATMPFIIITAFVQQEVRDRVMSLGVTEYITKPFDPAQLIATINNLVGWKRITP